MGITNTDRDLDKLTPETKERVIKFMDKAKEEGLKVMITEAYRSKARQLWLYSQGRTRPGKIVTWTTNSRHQLGEAVDVCFLINGAATYSGDWNKLGEIGESVGLSWGGRWHPADKPHFQLNHNYKEEHWATKFEKELIKKGIVKYKKDLTEPLSRGEAYVIFSKLLNQK